MEIIQGLGMAATLAWLMWARRDLASSLKDLSRRSSAAKLSDESTVRRRHPFANSEQGRYHHPNTSA